MISPITPPMLSELVQQWVKQWQQTSYKPNDLYIHITTAAAQWGWDQRGAANEAELQQRADQELDACCEWLDFYSAASDARDLLRLARRPKPPSLKKQALRILVENGTTLDGRIELEPEDIPIIRRALEALPND